MWQLKKEQNVPIYRSIMEMIVQKIQTGELLPGEKIPSERKLAEYLSVNRSTVVHALDELVDLGWIVRKRGSGTIVNEGKWGVMMTPRTDWHRYLEQNVFKQVHPLVAEIELRAKQNLPTDLDMYTGELPLDLIPSFDFPALNWKQFLKEEAQDELGYLPLRKEIQAITATEYQLHLPSESLLLTSGAQQALFLVLQVLLRQGDSVAVEDPSFFYALPIFQAAGVRLFGVPMTEEGIDLEALEQTIRQHRIKMVMVNPSFQNPTGTVMPLRKREQLVKVCQTYQVPILEDDVFGQLSFIPKTEIPPLKKLDPDNVLYIGSLSKILGSTTKIGWLSAPASVTKQIAEARKMMDVSLSIFPQMLAKMAIEDPSFSEKITLLNKQVEQRATAVYQAFKSLSEWEVSPVKGGFYLWAHWCQGALKPEDWQVFLREGVLVAPSVAFSEKRGSIRLNCSRISPEEIPLFCERMVRITRQLSENRQTKIEH